MSAAERSGGDIGIGTVIAETYEVTRMIGRGGMGAVYEATHRRLPGKRVAVKVLLNASTEGEALARFRREAEIASKLGNPNIVEVIDFHQLPSGEPYMILEFLEGESLAKRLKSGPIPVAQTLEIVKQIGSALHAAHREGVVHRDLKPDNIFLVPTDSGGVVSEKVKVLDFGISKIRGSSTVMTQDSALLGTPQYMSPEQAFGKNKQIDQRTDIWALGVIIYEMLSGKPAFHGDTLAQVILAIVHEEAPSLRGTPGIPEHVVAAVDRALRKDANERFADVQELIAALTGKRLETLDRKPIPSAVQRAFAGTAAAVDAMAATAGPAAGVDPLARTAGPTPSGATGPESLGVRGEVQIPETTNVRPEGKRGGTLAIVVGGLLAVGGVAAFLVLRPATKATTPTTPPPTVTTVAPMLPPPATPTPPPTAPAPVAPTPVAPTPVAPTPTAPTPTAPTPTAPTKPKVDKPDKVDKPGAVPPEVAADIAAAEEALAKKDYANAIHIARRAQSTKLTSRAQGVITRAFCAQGDLGNAKAAFRTVAGGDRKAIVATCKKNDIDLP